MEDKIYSSMVIRSLEETIERLEDEVNRQAKVIQMYEEEIRKLEKENDRESIVK